MQQGVEARAAARERQRRRGRIDLLSRQHVELGGGLAQALQLQQTQPVGRGAEPEAVFHGCAKPGEKRAGEAAKLLARRYRFVAVMKKLGKLALVAFLIGQIRHIADIVMRADEDEMIGVREKGAEGLDFGARGRLAGAEGIEADNNHRIGIANGRSVERGELAVIRHALNLRHGLALICSLTAFVAELYQTPDPALTVYVAFFLIKPDRVSSIILSLALLGVLTVTLPIVLATAVVAIDIPASRVGARRCFPSG